MISRHLRMIEYARELNVVPIMVFCQGGDASRLRELMACPGHPLSALGRLWQVAEMSVDGVLADMQDLIEGYDVRGIISCGDRYADAAAALCHLLDLPGAGWPAARISRNKLFQRYALPAYSPRWRVIHPSVRARIADLDWDWGVPLLIKPASRWGSLGVLELPSAADLPAVTESYPPEEILLVEERVFGDEFSVESLVQDGQLLWSGVTRKQTTEGRDGVFVELAHTAPADGLLPGQLAELITANADVLRRLDFRNGIAHAEYRLAERGVVMMEIALRVPGGGITAMWGLATGCSMEERLVEIALGRPTSYPPPVRRVRHAFLAQPEGVLGDVRCAGTTVSWTTRDACWPVPAAVGPDAPSRLCAVLVGKLAGDKVGKIETCDSRSVSVMVDAPLGDDINQVAERASHEVSIVIS